MIIILQYHYTLSIKVIYKHIDILYLCCSHAYFLDLVLIKHESHKSDTEPLKLHNVFCGKYHVSEPFAPQVLLIQIKKNTKSRQQIPAEPGGVGTPGNRGHLNQAGKWPKKPMCFTIQKFALRSKLVGG